MTDLYSTLYARKGKSYFDRDIKDFSLLKIYPEIDQSKKIKGNSRVSGDIDILSQHQVIDMLITISTRYKLTYKEISYILLCARIESGFNPDAAAGTTTAAGIGQATAAFVDYTYKNSSKRLGFTLDITGERIFDAELGCYALVFSFLRARDLVSDHYISTSNDYWRWMYYLHHDGMSSLRLYHQNKHVISKDATDCADDIISQMPIIESLLKTTTIETLFKLSTGDGTPVVNKNYVATVSLSPNTYCPKVVSDMNNPLIFIKGKTDGEGKSEGINALAGSEIVFTILKDNHKKLAMSENKVLSEKSKREAENHQLNYSNENIAGEYIVKPGDTLSVIAKSHGTTINNLARLNNLSNVNKLHIGQVLKLSNAQRTDEENRSNVNVDYISRYIPNEIKQAIMKYVGIENGNEKAAISYSRSHIVLPVGSTSADIDKNKNIVHIKTTKKSDSVKKRQQPPIKHKTDEEGTAKPMPTSNDFEPVVNFSVPKELKELVTSKSLDVIKKIMKSAKIHKITITSTLRTAQKQVNAMYTNMQSKGIQSQLDYYAAAGKEVVRAAISAGGNDLSKTNEVKRAMVNKVISLQKEGRLVSRHCVSKDMYSRRNVFDISMHFSTKKTVQLAFDKALTDYAKNNDGFKYISPFKHRGEPAFHVEIEQ